MSNIACYNCNTPTAIPQKASLEGKEIYFCPSCFTIAKSVVPSHICLLNTDAQYCQLRDFRNKERDRIEAGGFRGSVKHLDASLELYERKLGTDYCSVLYHNHLHR